MLPAERLALSIRLSKGFSVNQSLLSEPDLIYSFSKVSFNQLAVPLCVRGPGRFPVRCPSGGAAWCGVLCRGICSWLPLRAGPRSWEVLPPLRGLSSGFYVPCPRAVQLPPFSADFSQGGKPWSWGACRGLRRCRSLTRVAQLDFGGRGTGRAEQCWHAALCRKSLVL